MYNSLFSIRFVFCVLLLFTIGCKPQSGIEENETQLTASWSTIQILTMGNILSFSDNPMVYFKDGVEYYLNYNKEQNSLIFYNLQTSSYSHRVTFFNSGPNKVGGLPRASLWGDTIVSQLIDKIQLITLEGVVAKELSLKEIAGELDKHYCLKGDERMVNTNFKRLYVDEVSQSIVLRLYNKDDGYNDIYKNPKFLEYNLNTGLATPHHVVFPDELKKQYYGMLEYPNIISKGDSIIYNFPFKATVHIYNKKTQKTETVDFKPNQISPIVKGYDLAQKSDYSITLPLLNGDVYHQINYDRYRGVYYILYSQAKIGEESKCRHLITFDKYLRKIGEVELPEGLSPKYAISQKGLLFRNHKEDSFGTLTLHVLNVEVEDK